MYPTNKLYSIYCLCKGLYSVHSKLVYTLYVKKIMLELLIYISLIIFNINYLLFIYFYSLINVSIIIQHG